MAGSGVEKAGVGSPVRPTEEIVERLRGRDVCVNRSGYKGTDLKAMAGIALAG
jgi:hypothetical protein